MRRPLADRVAETMAAFRSWEGEDPPRAINNNGPAREMAQRLAYGAVTRRLGIDGGMWESETHGGGGVSPTFLVQGVVETDETNIMEQLVVHEFTCVVQLRGGKRWRLLHLWVS